MIQSIMTVLAYLASRLTETSTVNTLLLYVVAQLHIHFNPTFNTALVQLVVALFAVVGLVVKNSVFEQAPAKVKAYYIRVKAAKAAKAAGKY